MNYDNPVFVIAVKKHILPIYAEFAEFKKENKNDNRGALIFGNN